MRQELSRPRDLPWPLHLCAMVLLFAALICIGVVSYCRSEPALNRDPYNQPWFTERFPDLLLLMPRFQFFHSAQFFTAPGSTPYMYPAPDAVIYKLFYLLSGVHPVVFFVGITISAYVLAAALYCRALHRRGVPFPQSSVFAVAVLLCSYPLWFELRQANIEIVTWMLISGGIALFLANKSFPAAICFCLAGAMKFYPLIFLGLLLERKQYREIVVGLLTFAAVTVVSTWLLCPAFSYCWKNVHAGLDLFRDMYMLRKRYETGMDHSLFATLKELWRPLPTYRVLAVTLKAYTATTALLGVALWFARIRRQPVFNQVLALTIACILFPPTSFEYTLQHVLAPFALFTILLLDSYRLGHPVRFLKSYLFCFTLLLAPIPELICDEARLDGLIKSVVLLCLFVLSLRQSVALGDEPSEDAQHALAWWESSSVRTHLAHTTPASPAVAVSSCPSF